MHVATNHRRTELIIPASAALAPPADWALTDPDAPPPRVPAAIAVELTGSAAVRAWNQAVASLAKAA